MTGGALRPGRHQQQGGVRRAGSVGLGHGVVMARRHLAAGAEQRVGATHQRQSAERRVDLRGRPDLHDNGLRGAARAGRRQFGRDQGALALDRLLIGRRRTATGGGWRRGGSALAQALDLAVETRRLAARLARAPAVMAGRPPAHAEPRQHAQQKQQHDQQVDRHHDDMRQRPQDELHGLGVADRDQHAQRRDRRAGSLITDRGAGHGRERATPWRPCAARYKKDAPRSGALPAKAQPTSCRPTVRPASGLRRGRLPC
jgi:hypothetical protein